MRVLGGSSTCWDLTYLNIELVRRAVHFGFIQDKLLSADVEIKIESGLFSVGGRSYGELTDTEKVVESMGWKF